MTATTPANSLPSPNGDADAKAGPEILAAEEAASREAATFMTAAGARRGNARGYPRSFFRLLLVALALVSLPLSLALVYAAWRTEQFSMRSQSALYDAVHTARTSRALFDRLGSIDRLAQQTAVLGEPALLEDFVRAHRSFHEVALELRGLKLGERARGALERAIVLETSLLELLTTTPSGKVDRAELDQLVALLVQNTRLVMAASHSVVDNEADREHETEQRERIDRIAEAGHDGESGNDRTRDGYGRDNRRAHRTDKCVDHDEHEAQGNSERLADFQQGGANEDGGVDVDRELDVGRHRRL